MIQGRTRRSSMKATRWTLAVFAALAMAGSAYADQLGDKAPALSIKEWVKGKPVDVTKADGKSVYVIDFWATDCLPCIQGIPHITEMQHKYKNKNVTFIGVSTDDPQTVANVKPLVEKMGDKMDYIVAIDKDGATAKAYRDAHYVRGVPNAFVIDQQGRIVWVGHSMKDLEEVVEQVVSGKFDLEAARKEMAPVYEKRRRAWTQAEYMKKYFGLLRTGGGGKEAADLGQKLFENASGDAELMNRLAWDILTKPGVASRDLKLALRAAQIAVKLTEGAEPNILDTYALALFENGRKQEALEVQLKAVKLAREKYADEPGLLATFEERLDRYQKATE
jgi:thiol-disulfide isomerase/thioredoxin